MTRKCAETSPQLPDGCERQYPCTQIPPSLAQVMLLPTDARKTFAEVPVNIVTFPSRKPPANVFATPFTCSARKCQPLRISKHPNKRSTVLDLGAFPPRRLLIQCNAAMLSPSISTFSPPNRGFEPVPTTNATSVITIPSGLRTLFERSL